MNEGNYGSLKYLAPAIGWGMLIFLISALSGRSLSALNFTNLMSVDKWGHFAAYALLSYLVLWGL